MEMAQQEAAGEEMVAQEACAFQPVGVLAVSRSAFYDVFLHSPQVMSAKLTSTNHRRKAFPRLI